MRFFSPIHIVQCAAGLCAFIAGTATTGVSQIETGEIKRERPVRVEPIAAPAAEDKLIGVPGDDGLGFIDGAVKSEDAAQLGSSLLTRQGARTLFLTVPPPRGQILDRHGYPLAQTRVAFYAAINFPVLEDESEDAVLMYARERIIHTNEVLGELFDISTKKVYEHYKNRR